MRPEGRHADAPAAALSFRPRRMTKVINTLAAFHMAVQSGPPPKFPMWAVYGVSDFDSAGRPLGGRAEDYEAALERILSDHGHTDEPGIPLHKLRTNLGWHVTAAECAAALRAFEERAEPPPAVWGTRLLPFLRTARSGDGFEVH
jgi:hypothetical protein